MELIKLFGFAVVAIFLYALLKSYRPEFALSVVLVASAAVFLYALSLLSSVASELKSLVGGAGISEEYIEICIKALGILLITKLCADICNDSGSTALQSKVLFAGKCGVFIVVLPLFRQIFKTVAGLLI